LIPQQPVHSSFLFKQEPHMKNIFKMASWALMTGLTVASANAATYQGTFTAATVDIFDNSAFNGTGFVAGAAGAPVLIDRGPSISGAYGKARAELGSNGFMATSGAAGFSAWSDGFTLTGGSGAGEVDISVAIHGSIEGTEADMSYGLYVSDTPFGFDAVTALNDANLDAPLGHATKVLSYSINNANLSPNATLTGKLTFTYGQQFYVFSYLYGDVCTPLEGAGSAGCTGGSEDFFHSAVFGLTAPSTAAIATLSHHTYAAAVPESSAWVLAVAGFSAILMWRRPTKHI
jgi:hypothetical protein